MDFAVLRREMVEGQLARRGIRDSRVLAAMGHIPRELFVPEGLRNEAYEDHPLSIGLGQTISQPYMVALMTELLSVCGGERILEVGTGSGYQTAVLAELGCRVYSVERHADLAQKAEGLLAELGYREVIVRVADGTLGWPEEAPFDRVLVTAGAPEVPAALLEQLGDGGIVVIPVGRQMQQDLKRIRRQGGRWIEESAGGCFFVRLIGRQGWSDAD